MGEAARARPIFWRRGRAQASTLAGDGEKSVVRLHQQLAAEEREERKKKCCLHRRPPSALSMSAKAVPGDTRTSRVFAIVELVWERSELQRRDYKDLRGIEVCIWQVRWRSGSVNGSAWVITWWKNIIAAYARRSLAEVDRALCLFGGDGRLNINLFTEQLKKNKVSIICKKKKKNQRSEV